VLALLLSACGNGDLTQRLGLGNSNAVPPPGFAGAQQPYGQVPGGYPYPQGPAQAAQYPGGMPMLPPPRVTLGVFVDQVDLQYTQQFRLPPGAVAIMQLAPNGPAMLAGLVPGDIVYALDGQPMLSMDTLPQVLATRSPNDRLRVDYWRRGQLASTTVVLAPR
jgi:S1-C subfamily serine protease